MLEGRLGPLDRAVVAQTSGRRGCRSRRGQARCSGGRGPSRPGGSGGP
jgi:hypothetical protein